jgi:predicted nucleotidyltransferase
MAGQQDFTAQVMQILAHTLPQVRTLGAWLFGSHACGEAAPRSDLDLAVLAERRVDPMALGAAATALERIAGSRGPARGVPFPYDDPRHRACIRAQRVTRGAHRWLSTTPSPTNCEAPHRYTGV